MHDVRSQATTIQVSEAVRRAILARLFPVAAERAGDIAESNRPQCARLVINSVSRFQKFEVTP